MPTYHLNHPAFHQEYLSHTLEDTAMGNREPFKNSWLDGIHDLGKLFWQQQEEKEATKAERTASGWVPLLIQSPHYLLRACLVLVEQFS